MAVEEIACPSQLKFDTLKQLIRGWYMAGASKEEKKILDVEHVTGIHQAQVSRNNRFLLYLKILRKSGKGSFRLTPHGEKLASAIDLGLEEKAKMTLLSLCKDNEFCEKIYNYTKIPRAKEEVVGQAASIARVTSSQEKKMRGIRAVVDMLLWCGMLKEEDGKVCTSEVEIEKLPEVLAPSKKLATRKTGEPKELPSFFPIVLSVTPETSKEKIKEMIKWVLEAYDEYKKGKAE